MEHLATAIFITASWVAISDVDEVPDVLSIADVSEGTGTFVQVKLVLLLSFIMISVGFG